MNDEADHDRRQRPTDHLDDSLVRYAGDAVLKLVDGRSIDLNGLVHPFTGEPPQPVDSSAPCPRAGAEEAEALKILGHRLRILRENNEVSRAALANRTGLRVARVAGLEQGAIASLSIVSIVIDALGGRLGDVVDPDALARSNRELIKLATAAGAPKDLLRRILQHADPDDFPRALSRGFSWMFRDLMHGTPRAEPLDVVPVFKTLSDSTPIDSPVLALARTLSKLAVTTLLQDLPGYAPIPADPRAVREQVLACAEDLTLQALLTWTWGQGIVVIPLSAGSDFVAAVWSVEDRPVIVLNDRRTIAAYWLFDLAHELGHLACGHVGGEGIVEVGAPDSSDLEDEQEHEANDWALQLLLPDPTAMLIDVRRRTAGDAPRKFKFAVRDVAREAGISAGPLGLIAARALSDVPEDRDRWGSATNLAKEEDRDGRARVRDAFLSRADIKAAEPLDAALLRAAVLV